MRYRKEIIFRLFAILIMSALVVVAVVEAWIILRGRVTLDQTKAAQEAAKAGLEAAMADREELQEQVESLEKYRYNWNSKLILSDSTELNLLRRNLFLRSDVIPEEIEALEEVEFPLPEDRWAFLPLNLDGKEVNYYYVKANGGEGSVNLLFALEKDPESGEPLTDENNALIWTCIAYDAGEGWSLAEK